MNIILSTERLILRQLQLEDFDVFYHLDTDPVVKKYIGSALTEEQSRDRLRKAIEKYKDPSGLGRWMAAEKTSGKSIGWFLLDHLEDSGLIEIGYRLKECFWGKGYATEMAEKLLKYGIHTLGLKKIAGITNPRNFASKRVLEKIGLNYLEERFFYNQTVSFFEINT